MNPSIRIPERRCPHCDYVLTGTQVTSGPVAAPSPGDFSLCINCAEVSVFTEHGLRFPTAEEEKEIARDGELKRWQAATRELHRREGRR